MSHAFCVIKIKFRSKVGFILWASLDNNNLILACESNIMLFPACVDLEKFVMDHNPSNFDQLNGYSEFKLTPSSTLYFNEISYLNIDDSIDAISDLSKSTREDVLNSLNLLDDMLFTSYENHISRYSKNTKKLSKFLDNLTFGEDTDLEDLPVIKEEISKIADMVSKRTLTIGKY